jgi:tetratricopeptide (TPR) repeat protein
MILKKNKRHIALLISGLLCFFLTGCGSKTIMVEPRVKYGNPSGSHVKDIPEVRYKEQAEPLKNNKPPEINADEYEKLGDALLANGKYFMAFMQYENSLEKDKDNLRVEYKKGVAMLGGGRLKEAHNLFKIILEKKPDFALAYEGIGRINFRNKLYPVAKFNFEKAIGLDPLLWRSYSYLGHIHDIRKEYDLAVREYKTALTIKPGAGFVYNNLGVSLSMAGHYKEAVDSFYHALELGYGSNKVYNNLGQVLMKLDLYDKAFEAFKKADSEAVAWNNIGVGYLNNGRINKAAHCFKKAIELSPKFYVLANENLKKCRLKQK